MTEMTGLRWSQQPALSILLVLQKSLTLWQLFRTVVLRISSTIIHCFDDRIYGIDRILRGAGAPELGLSAFAAVVKGADFLGHAAEEESPHEAHPIPEVRQDDA